MESTHLSNPQHRRTAAPSQHTTYRDRPAYMGESCLAADFLLETDNPYEERKFQRMLDSTRNDY